jgi:molecular chaperone GrpE
MGSEREPEIETPARENAPLAQASTELEARVAELTARCADLEDRWLRSHADYQNLRRRSQADLESALRRTLLPLFADLLLVLDFLDLALTTPAEHEEARSIATGVQLIRTRLLQTFEAAGLEELPAQGAFDPAVHEAGGSRAAAGVASGTILEVARKGYRWRGQVVRPARVIVAAEPAASPDPG